MPSTDKTARFELSQLLSVDIFKFLTDYNSDMKKIDEHTHVIVSATQPDSLADDGSQLWYNPDRNIFYHYIGGKWQPIIDVINSLDSLEEDKPLSAAVGQQLKDLVDLRSSIFKSYPDEGVLADPTNFIFKVTSTQGNTNGFTDNMQISPNMGIRMLTEEEKSVLD